jgi:O-succinylbenzoic acid--CoA ligase
MMMIVRAIAGKLKLYILPPSSLPLLDEKIDFTALVPLQVYALWERIGNLEHYGTVIIGGATLSRKWITELKQSKNPIYATYGMTETVSHVALRKLNGSDAEESFHCLPGVSASVGLSQCLQLDIAHFDGLHLETQDIVELIDERRFTWIGRADNVINTGGIKVFPERMEEKLSSQLHMEFFISSEADERLGQRIVLCVEGKEDADAMNAICEKLLEKHERPKRIYQVEEMKKSATGKILKKETLTAALLLWSKDH